MMIIRFKKPAHNYGYSYKAGACAKSLPFKDCEYLIKIGIAEDITPQAKPKDSVVKKAKVKTTTIRK
jgi:hypothetical protein